MRRFTIIFKGDGKFGRQIVKAYSQNEALRRFDFLAKVLYFSYNVIEVLG